MPIQYPLGSSRVYSAWPSIAYQASWRGIEGVPAGANRSAVLVQDRIARYVVRDDEAERLRRWIRDRREPIRLQRQGLLEEIPHEPRVSKILIAARVRRRQQLRDLVPRA